MVLAIYLSIHLSINYIFLSIYLSIYLSINTVIDAFSYYWVRPYSRIVSELMIINTSEQYIDAFTTLVDIDDGDVYLSIHLSIYLSIYLYLSFTTHHRVWPHSRVMAQHVEVYINNGAIYLSICLSIYLSIYTHHWVWPHSRVMVQHVEVDIDNGAIYLFIHLSIYLSIYLSIHSFIHPSTDQSLSLSIFHHSPLGLATQ